MISTFDTNKGRMSDVIFDSLNRLYDAKLSGALKKDELSKLIISIGDVFASKIKQGRVSESEIESMETHLDIFTGKNADKYFSFPHQDLDRAAKSVLEGNDFAKQAIEQRNLSAQPVMSAESYERTFRRLG